MDVKKSVRAGLGLALTLTIAGCATRNLAPNSGAPVPGYLASAEEMARIPSTAQAPTPRVQNCGVVAISSPPKYVCDGKIYTSFELTRLRAEEQNKYRSGK